jgi:endo-alpha-1,4-polygalactosaminidase (GH114 family)
MKKRVFTAVIMVLAVLAVSCEMDPKIEYRDREVEKEVEVEVEKIEYRIPDPFTQEELKAKMEELYVGEPGSLGRLHKMQAFIMEIALHAKAKNSDFKIIPQDGINLAFTDGVYANGALPELMALVDGWGIESMLGTSGVTAEPDSEARRKYMILSQYEGLYVSETSTVTSETALTDYYARGNAWGIIPFPRIGAALAQILFPGERWANNSDYFWIEDPVKIGISSKIHSGNVYKLKDAKNYLYHINGRPYDDWASWDDEEAAAIGDGEPDRTTITDGYANGLLVPSAGGPYEPAGTTATVDAAKLTYGDEWDWWWRAKGYTANQGREIWLQDLRASNYDVIYIDSFYNHRARPQNQTPLTKAEVDSLKYKANGGRRQIIAYLSIGSAEQNRWYCQDDWIEPVGGLNSDYNVKSGYVTGGSYVPPPAGVPKWLADTYGGSYDEESIVQWWHPEWRDIIVRGGSPYAHKTTGDNTSSIDRIIAQGFDGVYLDNVGIYSRSNWAKFEEYWLANGGIPGEN